MKHFVLVHGAWHHPACWTLIQRLLKPYGKVYTPNLIPQKHFHEVHLSDYISCLKELIQTINAPVVLIGHSFAGFVITEVANHTPHLIEELIYINAFIPKNNETLFSLSANFEFQNLNPYLKMNTEQQSLAIEPIDSALKWMYQLSDNPSIEFRPEPLLPLNQSILYTPNPIYPRRAIIGQQDLCISAKDQIKMCERQNIAYQLIDADHCPFISNPMTLSQMILKGC